MNAQTSSPCFIKNKNLIYFEVSIILMPGGSARTQYYAKQSAHYQSRNAVCTTPDQGAIAEDEAVSAAPCIFLWLSN